MTVTTSIGTANTRILVTGASGNLGRALACLLAAPGVELALWGRDELRLKETSELCRSQGAVTDTRSLDLADLDGAITALREEDAANPFDVVLLVAGQGATRATGQIAEDAAQIARQCQVNFTAPAAMAADIAGRMAQRKHGKVAVIGSAAGFHSLPFAPSYAGSKAGLARFTDALRLAVKPHGVSITLATPGFIAAQVVDPAIPARPMEISAERAAKGIIAATMQGKARITVPRRFILLYWLDRILPRTLRDRLLLAMPDG